MIWLSSRRLPLRDGKLFPRGLGLMCWCIPVLPAWSIWGMSWGWGRISKIPGDVRFPSWEVWSLCWTSARKATKPAKPSVPQAVSLGGRGGCPNLRNPLSQEGTQPLSPEVAQTAQKDLFSWSHLHSSAKPHPSAWRLLVAFSDMAPHRTWCPHCVCAARSGSL